MNLLKKPVVSLLLLFISTTHGFAQTTANAILLKSRQAILSYSVFKYRVSYKVKLPDKEDTSSYPVHQCVLERHLTDSILGFYGIVKNLAKWEADDKIYRTERIYDGLNFYFINHNNKYITSSNPHRDPKGIGFTRSNMLLSLMPGFLYSALPYRFYLSGVNKIELLGTAKVNKSDCWKISIELKVEDPITSRTDIIYIDRKTYLPVRTELRAVWEKIQTEYQELVINYQDNDKKISHDFATFYQYPKDYKLEPYVTKTIDYALLETGTSAPGFSFNDVYGQQYGLDNNSEHPKLILLDFWYLGCQPCLMAMPELIKLREKYKEKGLLIMGMNSFDLTQTRLKQIKKLVALKGINYPLLVTDKNVEEQFKVKIYPTIYLIADGKIIYSLLGYTEESIADLENIIKTRLN